MAKSNEIEYGFVIGNVGPKSGDGVISKPEFLAEVKRQYPSSEGWKLTHVTTAPLSGLIFTVSYHFVRGDE